MIIRGHFIADVPFDRDVRYLEIPHEALEPAEVPIMGIGGSVRSFVRRNVEVTFATM